MIDAANVSSGIIIMFDDGKYEIISTRTRNKAHRTNTTHLEYRFCGKHVPYIIQCHVPTLSHAFKPSDIFVLRKIEVSCFIFWIIISHPEKRLGKLGDRESGKSMLHDSMTTSPQIQFSKLRLRAQIYPMSQFL